MKLMRNGAVAIALCSFALPALAGGGGRLSGVPNSMNRLVRGNPADKEIALTFDDGPHPGYTQRILDILETEHVKATFFVVGSQVDIHPELARMESVDGHEVANHTYDHVRLPTLTPTEVTRQLVLGAKSIERATGVSPRFFRPPGGEYDEVTVEAAHKLGYIMTLWTDDPGDFADPGAAVILKRTLRYANNGGILLLHDGTEQTIQILPELIHRLKSQGFRFVTVTEMAEDRGAITHGGPMVYPKSREKTGRMALQ